MDTELLGLKYELISYLSDHDIEMYDHYSEIEADLGNREITLVFPGDYTSAETNILLRWAKEHGFTLYQISKETGKVKLKRGKDDDEAWRGQ